MIRETVAQRPDWQDKVEARGLIWHTNKDPAGDKPYWDEGTFYRFDRIEVDLIEGGDRRTLPPVPGSGAGGDRRSAGAGDLRHPGPLPRCDPAGVER
jgi:hypothetical protein